MIIQCDDLERALRTPELMPDARAHAEHCEKCREQLYLWSEISRLAPQLHQEWDSPSLWPRIHTELAAAPRLRARVPVWRWALAAAAVVALALVLSQPRQPQPAPVAATRTGGDFLTDDALREVQQAEAAYTRSINRLSTVVGAGLEHSASPLAGVYREKLLLLDSAIAELKVNIESNRYNTYLRTELASLYREKQKTLQDWMEHANRK
jgi:hypothetical protein